MSEKDNEAAEEPTVFVDEAVPGIEYSIEGCASEMCGISGPGICRLRELTSGQLGFTKQLVSSFRMLLF